MRVLVVVNPKSGRPLKTSLTAHLEMLLAEAAKTKPFAYHIVELPEENAEKAVSTEIQEFKPDILAGAGGDGTISLLSRLLLNSPAALLIIPAGSANGMAKELAIGNIEQAAGLLNDGVIREIDALKINGKTCIHLADVGLNARIVKRFEKDTRRGILTYAKHLWYELFLIKQYKFYIHYDDTEISKKAVSLTFANASKYGTGAVINPTGHIDDGKFELVIVKPFPAVKLLSLTFKMFTGKLQTSEYVDVISCSSAYIRASKKTTLQIDGEVIGKTREIKIEILKNALKVLVPADSV